MFNIGITPWFAEKNNLLERAMKDHPGDLARVTVSPGSKLVSPGTYQDHGRSENQMVLIKLRSDTKLEYIVTHHIST